MAEIKVGNSGEVWPKKNSKLTSPLVDPWRAKRWYEYRLFASR